MWRVWQIRVFWTCAKAGSRVSSSPTENPYILYIPSIAHTIWLLPSLILGVPIIRIIGYWGLFRGPLFIQTPMLFMYFIDAKARRRLRPRFWALWIPRRWTCRTRRDTQSPRRIQELDPPQIWTPVLLWCRLWNLKVDLRFGFGHLRRSEELRRAVENWLHSAGSEGFHDFQILGSLLVQCHLDPKVCKRMAQNL